MLNILTIKKTIVLSGQWPNRSRAFTAAVRAHQRCGNNAPMALTPPVTLPPKPARP